MIVITTAALQQISKSPLLQKRKRRLEVYMTESKAIGVGEPMILFKGPWLGICGYSPGGGPKAKAYKLLGVSIKISASLIKKMQNRTIDVKTVWDPRTGLSHTGLYLR